MLERLKVHGFRTLVDTEIRFDPLTIMIGKNGTGKTTILDMMVSTAGAVYKSPLPHIARRS